MRRFLVILLALHGGASFASNMAPDATLTPGALCSEGDSNFKGYDYPERVARCNRNIKKAEKIRVAGNYGNIPEDEWSNYEFDHLIPLCAGGSNDDANLWPQPIDEARQKDVIENSVCIEMKAGKMTQKEAIAKLQAFFVASVVTEFKDGLDVTTPVLGSVLCTSMDGSKVRFDVLGASQIEETTLYRKNQKGALVSLHIDEGITGLLANRRTIPALAGKSRYVLDENNVDHFDLYLPANLETTPSPFQAFLRTRIHLNKARLTRLSCVQN